ncbi:DUF616 domain-containing protein [Methanobrevibacter sp. OttesenSCG-928-K11]|nr:DUF616 domain-containing protein [Methanobrevibacter sp. OttesenSCG-928-K11]MDL2271091.1 DUF616 domain-containing protein [Methanobrevibacter sp. OttesenSCG-928-I08]
MNDSDIDPYEGIREIHESNVDKFIQNDLFAPFKEVDESLIEDIKNNKILIYTAFTGDYDNLKEPDFIDENCDYICFTENPNLTSDIWDIKLMEPSNLDDNRKAKRYKVLPHKYFSEYKYSFWIDGTFRIKGSLREYIYKYINSPMLCAIHPERECLYVEANVSCIFSRYSDYTVAKQVKRYEEDNMPTDYGLPALGAIFRQHNNPKIIELMNRWWDEISEYTNQDQLSLTYLMWKLNFHPSISDVYYWINEYWAKEGEYHHKHEVKSPLCSDNLVESIEGNIKDENTLSKEELFLLINDIETLKHELKMKEDISLMQEKEINELKNSTSWKVTKPLRGVTRLIKGNK